MPEVTLPVHKTTKDRTLSEIFSGDFEKHIDFILRFAGTFKIHKIREF